jgi:CRISPR-associated exonuclease Cas4
MLGLYIAILLGFIALLLFIFAARQRQQTGIPAGRIIYVDTSQWGRVERPLYDPELRLTGKPDYLVKQGSQVIPIEVKSRHAPPAPHDSHIYQLAAYCLLVEHEYANRPAYGIIHYTDKSFAVDNTAELAETVRESIHEMQARPSHSTTDRSHQEGKRCQHCGYRSICDQALRI